MATKQVNDFDERFIKIVHFNTSVSKRKFKEVLTKFGYAEVAMIEELDEKLLGYAIWSANQYYVAARPSEKSLLIRLWEIPQFEVLPTKEAFEAYLMAWVPSEPDAEISNNP